MGLLMLAGSLQAAKLVTDNLPGLPGQSDAYWAERRKEQAEQQKRQQSQLVNLREPIVKQDVAYQENKQVCFYTGKPFDAELNSYIFKFRNYSPETMRWNTADPSGFPDGANNYCYVMIPIIALDRDGFKQVVSQETYGYSQYAMFSWGELAAWGGSGAIGGATGGGVIVAVLGGPPGWIIGGLSGAAAISAVLAGANIAYTDFQTQINNAYPGEDAYGRVWGSVTSTSYTNVDDSSYEIATGKYWANNNFDWEWSSSGIKFTVNIVSIKDYYYE